MRSNESQSPAKVPVHPWDTPLHNWECIHIDYTQPMGGYYFLKCIDAKSNWLEVKILKDAPTSFIALLEVIFSVHGYPHCQRLMSLTFFQNNFS